MTDLLFKLWLFSCLAVLSLFLPSLLLQAFTGREVTVYFHRLFSQSTTGTQRGLSLERALHGPAQFQEYSSNWLLSLRMLQIM